MQTRQLHDVVMFKMPSGRILGFHSHNLEMAELEPSHWEGQDNASLMAWNNEKSSTASDAVLNREFTHLSINVAQVCNLRCGYCAASGDGSYGSDAKKLDTAPALRMIQKFLNGCGERFHIHFLGGEPLLYPKIIRELCQYANLMISGSQKTVEFSVTTNGTLINSTVADLLSQYRFSVTVSIDGPKEINDRTRPALGKQSSTDMTVKGLENLRQIREHLSELKVNCVFGKHNMEIVRAWEFLRALNLKWDNYNFNYANNDADNDLTDKYLIQMDALAREAYGVGGLEELSRITQFHRPLSRLAAQTRLHNYCGAGKSLLQMDTRGDLYTCNWFMNDKSEAIGHGDRVDTIATTETMIEQNNCGQCWARHLCGGGCMAVHKAHSGSKHVKDPLFCRRTRHLAATAMSYYVNAFV